jgi:hypothetical protein
MPGGILILTAYGSQDLLLTGNPSISYFIYQAKRHTHFAKEPTILIPEKTASFLDGNLTNEVRCKIKRIGDFVGSMNLLIRLPPLVVPLPTGGADDLSEIRWVRHPGLRIINEIRVNVGGADVQIFDSERLFAIQEMDLASKEKVIYRRMIGDIPELVDPKNGIYAHTGGGYPTISGTDTFSIPETILRIPLPWWFTKEPSSYLPIGFLQRHEAEIILRLSTWRSMIQIKDSTQSETEWVSPPDGFELYPYLPDGNASWNLEPRFESVYYYVDTAERERIAKAELMIPVYRLSRYDQYSYAQNPSFSGNVAGIVASTIRTDSVVFRVRQENQPLRRVLIIPRREDFLNRNEWLNLTNWSNPAVGRDASGLILPVGKDIIQSMRFQVNGNPIFDDVFGGYLRDYDAYEYNSGGGFEGLGCYSFSLFNEPMDSKGTLNLSRVREPRISIQIPPVLQQPSPYIITLLLECVNWFHYTNGFGGLRFAS